MKAATWLLTGFGIDDALVGDLIEQRTPDVHARACGVKQPVP